MADSTRLVTGDEIAVIGMAGRFPRARNIHEFWQNLRDGVEGTSRVTAEDLRKLGVDPTVLDDPDYVSEVFALDDADLFDAEFFGFSPREAEMMDPQQRLFLESCYNALEHAGYNSETYPGLIGVFGGVGRNAYYLHAIRWRPELLETSGEYAALIGNERDFPTTHVSYKLDLRGPSVDVQTACSTSGVAIHLACQSLRAGDCNIALAGGCKIVYPNREGYWYIEGGPLAPEGHIRAFDADAKGMVRGSGAAVLVLKRLEEALADGDTVYAVVLGSALNNDGGTKAGFTAPTVSGQAAVIAEAQIAAGVTADAISYVECHGTGTVLGDPIEVRGLTEAFRQTSERVQYCAIGSVKTNIGHLDAGATAAGLIKTVLSLYHEQLPPSLNFKRPNPQIDWARTPFFVNDRVRSWPRSESPRRAGVSSFGLGSTNAHIVLEEAPVQESMPGRRDHELVLASARTPAALDQAIVDLGDFLEASHELQLADVAHTLQVGRRHWSHRRAIVARNIEEAVSALKCTDSSSRADLDGNVPSLAFMFPGGGAQYVGMAAGLFASEPAFRRGVEECGTLMSDIARKALSEFVEPKSALAESDLERPAVALPALFAVEYALASLWSSWGLKPNALIGHSMGEYTAACLAGVFSLPEAIRIVSVRGELFEKLPEGRMLSVPVAEEELRPLLTTDLSIAAVNRPGGCVVSGPATAIERLEGALESRDIESTRIHISVAAHSQMVEPILAEFEAAFRSVRLVEPRIPIVSNVTGTWLTAQEATDPTYWVRQLRHTVRFADGLATLLNDPRRILLEVGPGQTLSTFARQHPARGQRQSVIPSVRHPHETVPDDRFLLGALGRLWECGVEVDWSGFRGDERRRRVGIPTYPFQRQRYALVREEPLAETGLSTSFAVRRLKTGAVPTQRSTDDREKIDAPKDGAGSADLPLPEKPPIPLPPNMPQETASRYDRIVNELRATLQSLSGLDQSRISVTATFLELGFDSLFLAQANNAFKKLFKVKLTTRHLLERTPSISTLADYLDKELPKDAIPVPQAPLPKAMQSRTLPASAETPRPVPPLAPEAPVMAAKHQDSALERVIAQQLQVMQAQLAALGNGKPAVDAVKVDQLPVTRVLEARPLASSAPPEMLAAGTPDRTSPWQPVQKTGTATELTLAQRAHVESLVQEVLKLTPKSKAATQASRAVLADPRTVQGFRKQWKEIVYPIVSDRARGSKIWDIDGNEYIDLVSGYGANFFGHAPDFIIEAAQKQLSKTIAIGPQTPLAGEVAGLVSELTGMERVAFCNTGSEAVLAAIRCARTVTGKTKLATFSGHYHGIFDEVLVKGAGQGAERRAVPISPGIRAAAVEDVIVLEYDNPASLDAIRKQADEIALVLVEPVRSRNLDLQPKQFLQNLRKVTEELGIPLLFDEMITGFRSHPGGAQALFGVRADLATYGKVIGGGFPIGVVAGRREYLDALDGGMWSFGDESTPEADMTWFAGTFVRHPLALAAAKAALTHLRDQGPQLQERLNARTAEFVSDLNSYFKSLSAPLHIEHFSSAFVVTFPAFQEYSALLFYHLRNRGIYTYESRPAFFTLAHTEEDFRRVADAFKESVRVMQEAGLLSGGASAGATAPRRIALAEGQQEIWLATQFGQDASRAFNLGSTVRLRGPLRLDALERALQRLVDRHESLRAVPESDGHTQRILPALSIPLSVFDLSAMAADERDREMLRLRDLEVQTAFDLASGPLVRAKLIRLAANDHLLVVTAHHIVCDGWSCGVIMSDLGKLYGAECGEGTPELRPVMQLSEFVTQSAANRECESRSESEQYWLQEFSASIPILELPTDRPRPPKKTFRAKRVWLPVEADFVRSAKQLASSNGATMFATLLTGFAALLHRLSNQEDLVVGFSLAEQSNITDRDLVGHCVKFLPLHLHPRRDDRFSELLTTVRGKVLDAIENQNLAFGALIQKLKVRRDPSRIPLMSVAFNLDPSGRAPAFGDLSVEPGSVPRQYENFDLFFNLVELSGDRLEIQCTFNLDLFDETTIRHWLQQYVEIIETAVMSPQIALGGLPMSSKAEAAGENAASLMGAPLADTLHTRFDRQAARSPDAVAVKCGGELLTYRQLEARANQLAHQLHALGIGTESLVGLVHERSLDLVVGVLGILKAGAAYVPVDVTNPTDRVAAILGDAKVSAVVTQRSVASSLPSSLPLVRLDADAGQLHALPTHAPAVQVTGENAAYVIYTSGSTGMPKGVVVTHSNVVRLFDSTSHWFNYAPTDVWTLFHSIAFDVSVGELWGALLYGGRLVVVPQDVTRAPDRFHQLIVTEGVTMLRQTPSAFRMLMHADGALRPGANAALRYIIFAGEALDFQSLRPWVAAHGDEAPQLVNMYGITETTVDVTYRRVRQVDVERSTGSLIGVPIPDLQLYLLDERQKPVPPGVPGEIYVGGAGVARGYLNRPELNAQRFLPDPFAGKPGARMYRSGDSARTTTDGDLEYLGRLDTQVKIRGFRIELGEIESTVRQTPGIRDAAVLARQDEPGDKVLVAYVVPHATNGDFVDAAARLRDEVREFARTRLPDHMVPRAVVVLRNLPLTTNGKLNARALPRPESVAVETANQTPDPNTELERSIAAAWRDVLRVERIGRHDNFFDLGGHSLLGVQVMMQLRQQLGVELSLGSLFESPTVAHLARRVEALQYIQSTAAANSSAEYETVEL